MPTPTSCMLGTLQIPWGCAPAAYNGGSRDARSHLHDCNIVTVLYVDLAWREGEIQLTRSFIFQPILPSTYHVPGPALCAKDPASPPGICLITSLAAPLRLQGHTSPPLQAAVDSSGDWVSGRWWGWNERMRGRAASTGAPPSAHSAASLMLSP